MGYLPEVFDKKLNAFFTRVFRNRKPEEFRKFLSELFTRTEMEMILKRLDVLDMLKEGFAQRTVANVCKVSISKVVRLANVLKWKIEL